MNLYLRYALDFLQREVMHGHVRGVEMYVDSDSLLRIRLVAEHRDLWLGHEEGQGYFVLRKPDEKPQVFFPLSDELVTTLLSLPASDTRAEVAKPRDSSMSDAVRDLLESISSAEPNAERLRHVVDRLSVTERGLDIFATIAAIKAYRAAIDRFAHLLTTGSNAEREYHELFKQHPWMLGSQYCTVVASERPIWFGARVDLVLASAVGHVEIVELKRPDTSLLVRGTRARTWKASSDLSDALAQARAYMRILDEHGTDIEKELGLATQSMSRLYRSAVVIVAGRCPSDPDACIALRDFKMNDPRLILMTYDDVLAIAEATVQLFERRLEPLAEATRLLG